MSKILPRPSLLLSNVGVASVFVTKKTTLRIELTATATVVDIVSNVGGTLGLFLGFSFLSAVEAVYWALVALMGWAKRRRCFVF